LLEPVQVYKEKKRNGNVKWKVAREEGGRGQKTESLQTAG
jgi:hypothetical protein